MTATAIINETRAKAKHLVRREEYHTSSRMLAYHNVGSMVGTSASWLRKFVNGYDAGLSFVTGMNILALYERHCTRVEQEAAATNQRAAFIEEATHALRARTLGQMEGLPPRETGNGSVAKGLRQRG